VAGAEIRLVRAESLAPRPPVASQGQHPITERADRMARFAAGARRFVVRAIAIGALMAAGWLFAVLFGMLTAAPAASKAVPAAAEAVPATAGAVPAAAEALSATGTSAPSAATNVAAGGVAAAEGVADGVAAAEGVADGVAAAEGVADGVVVGQAGSPQMFAPQALVGADIAAASDNAQAMAGRTVDGLNSQRDPGLPAPSTAGKILDTNGLVPNGGGGGAAGSAAGDVARSVYDPRLQARRAPLAFVLPPVVRTAADDPSFSPD
jgi:hypothetical protein